MSEREPFDVYVHGDIILEVSRGEAQTVARQFGVDWDGASASYIHSQVLGSARRAAISDDLRQGDAHSGPRFWLALVAVSLFFVCGALAALLAQRLWR